MTCRGKGFYKAKLAFHISIYVSIISHESLMYEDNVKMCQKYAAVLPRILHFGLFLDLEHFQIVMPYLDFESSWHI